MSTKKNIDDLFKEQLQNFEAAPSPAVWTHIQTKIKQEDEDRKVIPLWWKVGGIAASLVLLLAVGFMVKGNDDASNQEQYVKEDVYTIENNQTSPTTIKDTSDKAIANDDELESKKSNDPLIDTSKIIQENNYSQNNQEAIANEVKKKDSSKNKNLNNSSIIEKESKIYDATASTSQKESNSVTKQNKKDPLIIKKSLTEAKKTMDAVASSKEVINNSSSEMDKIKKTSIDRNELIKDATEVTTNGTIETEVAIVKNKENNDDTKNPSETNIHSDSNKVVSKDISEENKIEEAVALEKIEEENKKSIFDAIEEDKEDAVAKEEPKETHHWEVTPNFGPVFYNSLSEGSSIDPSFSDNSQNTETNFSYGVQVSYNVTDRLSIRTGVSNVNLGYSTGDIELATGPVAVALRSVNYDGQSNVLSAFDKGTLNDLPTPNSGDPFGDLQPKRNGGSAEIIQNLSYYEVPMELKYALLDSKFGIHMVGGLSTLILGENEISVQDNNSSEVLGSANNLNQVSFSTNVGVGFNYKISKRLKFNVEPMFKYQLNPYSDSSVDFKPYYLGVYSGLSFKF